MVSSKKKEDFFNAGDCNDNYDPVFVLAIVGKGKLSTLNEIKEFFDMLDGFELIYTRTTKGKKLYIKEE